MKKSYIQPETTVYDMELQEIIATSVGMSNSSADPDCEVEISRRRTRDTEW